MLQSMWSQRVRHDFATNTRLWYLAQNRYLSVVATGLILSLIVDITLGPSPSAGILFREL